jgi:predicted transposase/invertase (TIGR01784 family)
MTAADNAEPQDTGAQSIKHDESYKSILSDIDGFVHFIRKYFHVLWADYITAENTARINTSYIIPGYSRIDSDIIYKTKLGSSDVYFYILVELQSQVDFTMPFRLLRYMVELLHDIFKNIDASVRERKDFRLPAIVPIVLYNGYDDWTAAKTFREYTADYERFGKNIIDFEYLLFNLKQRDEKELLPIDNVLDAFLSLDKRRLEKRLSPEEFVSWWTEQAPNLSTEDKDTLINWMERVLYRGEFSPTEMETLKQSLMKGETVTMTHSLAAWRDELFDEGKQVGILEGKQAGILEEDVKLAKKFKEEGVDVSIIAKVTGLTEDEIRGM